jgi:hypothetical protein
MIRRRSKLQLSQPLMQAGGHCGWEDVYFLWANPWFVWAAR